MYANVVSVGRKFAFAILVVTLFLTALPVWAERPEWNTSVDPSVEWQGAAFNYESAAEAQQVAAEEMLNQARSLLESTVEEPQLRRGRIQAGNLKLRAADMFLASANNYDSASRTWRQTSSAAGAAAHQSFAAASDLAKRRATFSIRKAVELCEQAATEFAGVGELISQAAASQKAGGIREMLAKR